MDKKEEQLFNHYKDIIENRNFNEYDVLGFLIVIRRLIINDSKFEGIMEFANLIAHRERNRGKAMTAIFEAYNNNYETEDGSKKVKGYNGIKIEQLDNEFFEFGKKYNVNFTTEILRELYLCLFSLAQFANYKNNNISGKILLVRVNNDIGLVTSENRNDSPLVFFSLIKNIKFVENVPGGIYENVVETVRENGNLRLKDKDGYII